VEVVALPQEAEAVLPLGVVAAQPPAVVRPPEEAEAEAPPPARRAQERPEDRERGMGTARGRADMVDTAGSLEMGGTEEMEDMVVKT
jgi:hypothetical protein